MASNVLKFMARIFEPQKNQNYAKFEEYLATVKKETLMKCNFGQFLNQPKEEKYVLTVLDAYLQGRVNYSAVVGRQGKGYSQQMKNVQQLTQIVPSNVFATEYEYKYFTQLYSKWKNKEQLSRQIIRNHGDNAQVIASKSGTNQRLINPSLLGIGRLDSESSQGSNHITKKDS